VTGGEAFTLESEMAGGGPPENIKSGQMHGMHLGGSGVIYRR